MVCVTLNSFDGVYVVTMMSHDSMSHDLMSHDLLYLQVLSDQLLLPQKIIEIPQTEEIPRNTKSFFCISTPLLLTGGGRGGAMTSHPNNCVCKQCANTVI